MTKWITGRKTLTVVVLALASALLWSAKLTSGDWALVALGCLTGHHLPDILKAWRSPGAINPS